MSNTSRTVGEALLRGKAERHAIVFMTPENTLEPLTDEFGAEVQFSDRAEAEQFVKDNPAKGLLLIQTVAKRVYRRNTGEHVTPDVPEVAPKASRKAKATATATASIPGQGIDAPAEQPASV